ncbi:LPD28 domain-containing protein [Alistipes communis]|uniref:LPD28 domain-containing protein n=1 Tax=Alistipes communis TaxID=2585118 RepID=UPI002938E027|nr:LPD28 domain-containing protein [Alistipes communis]
MSASRTTATCWLQIEPAVRVNHAGTILSRKEFPMEDWGGAEIEDYNFEGDETTLEEWLEQNQ